MTAFEMSVTPNTNGWFRHLIEVSQGLWYGPLDRTLENAGIKVLPRNLVREHMKNEIAKYRPQWVTWIMNAKQCIHWTMVILFLPTVATGLYALLWERGINIVMWAGISIAMLGLVFIGCTILLLIVVNRRYSHLSLLQRSRILGARWHFLKLPPGETLDIPHRIAKRTKTAMRVPSVSIKRAEFDSDPIVFAYQRNWLGIMVRAPIGAYETGTELDNM